MKFIAMVKNCWGYYAGGFKRVLQTARPIPTAGTIILLLKFDFIAFARRMKVIKLIIKPVFELLGMMWSR